METLIWPSGAGAAGEYEQLMTEANAVVNFIKNELYFLEELQATTKYEDLLNFDEFKKIDFEKFFGSTDDGQEWHHIVEQGIKDDSITIRNLQSTTNIVRLPKALHELITSEHSSLVENGNVTLRNSLKGSSFDERRAVGLKFLKNLGILKD